MAGRDPEVILQKKLAELEKQLAEQTSRNNAAMDTLRQSVTDLQSLTSQYEDQLKDKDSISGGKFADLHTRRVEWTIDDFHKKSANLMKGDSLWSPRFNAMGMKDLQLEFFPKGREKTTFEGFCSLFLWCPSGSKLKYQLWVGSYVRAPDEDGYTGRIGHGHSNFCPLEPEIDQVQDCITVGVNFVSVSTVTTEANGKDGVLRLVPTTMESLLAKEADVMAQKTVSKVTWRIPNVKQKMDSLPKGASMWSDLFTAAGIREILLEFYPNGSTNTTKEGYCAFYIRCPEGVSMVVTLFVGTVKKGPIKTTFDNLTGKGLPDFCSITDQINSDGSIDVGIELQAQPNKTLTLTTE
jgi:hypothetical protein